MATLLTSFRRQLGLEESCSKVPTLITSFFLSYLTDTTNYSFLYACLLQLQILSIGLHFYFIAFLTIGNRSYLISFRLICLLTPFPEFLPLPFVLHCLLCSLFCLGCVEFYYSPAECSIVDVPGACFNLPPSRDMLFGVLSLFPAFLPFGVLMAFISLLPFHPYIYPFCLLMPSTRSSLLFSPIDL